MAAFGLDDVRESYTSDVTRFLSEVESNARTVASSATLVIPAERRWQQPVDAMVVGLHGIVGSSSLIGLDSMTTTSRQLESIAGAASESIRMIRWHATRLHRIAAMCLDGAADLRRILESELTGRTTDATAQSAALHARLERATSSLAQGPGPEHAMSEVVRPVAGFAASSQRIKIPDIPRPGAPPPVDAGWDDVTVAGSPPPAPPGAPGGDDELSRTFGDEVRETLHNLGGYWARLSRAADDDEAAAQCARLVHLLRGAAAVVGQDAIARSASELHAWFDAARAQPLTADVVHELGRRIEDLVELAVGERPQLLQASGAVAAAASGAPAADAAPAFAGDPGAKRGAAVDGVGAGHGGAEGADDEPRQIFLDEARRAIDELWALASEVRTGSGVARGVAASRTERLFHRLKGSALIVDEAEIAEAATRGQALCEALERVEPAALEGLVQHIAALVGQRPRAARRAVEPTQRIALPRGAEWDAFLEESSALLDDLDRLLARLEQSARPTSELSAMFRHYHTLKGAASSVGLAAIGQQVHIIESFVERALAGPTLPELRQVATVLAGEHAAIRASIARASAHAPAHAVIDVDLARTTAQLAAIGDRSSSSGASWIAANDPVWTPASEARPDSDAHDSHASHASYASHDDHGSRGSVDPAGSALEPSMIDETAGARRYVRVAADRLDGLLDLVGELVVARSRILTRIGRLQHLQDEGQTRHGAVVKQIDDFVAATEFANLDGRRLRRGSRTSVRAGAVRAIAGGGGFGALELDHYEEIHVLARQLDERASDLHEMRRDVASEMGRLTEDAEGLSAIVGELQTEITQARMITVEALFTRLQLPIRDAAQRLGREIEIVTRGDDVAIDKAISDALFGPLLHVVRNAVVHGIEAPGRRLELAKPRAGTLSLVARQDHGQVVLEVSDDGSGIDAARLKAIGVERGLIDPATPEADPRVLDLVFVHGLSTSGEADDVAGRGVGGNVIRRAVDRLNGSIEITTGRGTGTTFRIALPLSLSITQAFVVRSAGVSLAIPLAFAETILLRESVEIVDTFGRTLVMIDGHMMPVHVTQRLFGEPAGPPGGVLVVCAVGTERIAIHADEVVGQEEIVVKSLGSLLDGHPLFSGCTQRGDGELVLILDIPGVLTAETSTVAMATPAGPRPTVSLRARAASAAPTAPAAPTASSAPSAPTAVAGVSLTAPAAPAAPAASPAPSAPTAVAGVSLTAPTVKIKPAATGEPAAIAAPEPPLSSRPMVAPPVVAAPPAPLTAGAIPVTEIIALPPEKLRVLFVDDSLSVRKVAERMLRALGVEVVTAIDGQDALDKLRTTAFSLVFTDLEMPRVHGYELIREMQYMPAYRAIPVVVISSRSGSKHVEQALGMGAREYLTKPFSAEILQGVLNRLARPERPS